MRPARLALALCLAMAPATADEQGPGGARLQRVTFADLPGFAGDDHLAAFRTFATGCAAILEDRPAIRAGLPTPAALVDACRRAATLGPADGAAARAFFESAFIPWRVVPPAGRGFLTGYYEPIVEASRTATSRFATPVLSRPDDLVTLTPGTIPGLDPALAGARRGQDGGLGPYPDRAAIEDAPSGSHGAPIAYLRDSVELFLIQVQGSARLRFIDGGEARLAYAGRNGLPYSSIGRFLVESGAIAQDEMSLARLKQWLRAAGLGPGEAGRDVMRRNRSYVFFRLDFDSLGDPGPRGAAGVPLTPLRSIAVDRGLWPYGLPVWIDAALPWRSPEETPFRRLMIGQDTGSAILGPARADIFLGSGEEAGARAGDIRHPTDFFVLLPKAAP